MSNRSKAVPEDSDQLSHVMRSLSFRDVQECCVELRAPWGLRVGGPERCSLVALRRGEARLQVGNAELQMREGDLCILLEPGEALLSDGPAPAHTSCPDGPCTLLREPGATSQAIVGSFRLLDRLAHPFLARLPPILHLVQSDTEGRISRSLELLEAESSDPGMGSPLSIAYIFEILFVQTLRAYLERSCTVCEQSGPSWLRAVTDPELYPALEAIHAHPRTAWTVESLARQAGMSRTTFATRFQASMGSSPMHYVVRWRLHLGATALSQHATLGEAAARAGYGTEASFAKAFKREIGVSPGQFRREYSTGPEA